MRLVVVDMSLQLQRWGIDAFLMGPSRSKESGYMAAGWELLVERKSNLDADIATVRIPY